MWKVKSKHVPVVQFFDRKEGNPMLVVRDEGKKKRPELKCSREMLNQIRQPENWHAYSSSGECYSCHSVGLICLLIKQVKTGQQVEKWYCPRCGTNTASTIQPPPKVEPTITVTWTGRDEPSGARQLNVRQRDEPKPAAVELTVDDDLD